MKRDSKKAALVLAALMCIMLTACDEATGTQGTTRQTATTSNAETTEATATTSDAEEAAITMEGIISANTNESLTSQFGSFQITLEDDEGILVTYVDADGFAYIGRPDEDYGELYVNNERVYTHYSDVYRGQMTIGDEPELLYTDNILFSSSSVLEEIKSCEEVDGMIFLTTELSPEDTEFSLTSRDYTYDEGGYLQIEYILDAETLAELTITEIEIRTDDTERLIGTAYVDYGVDMPERAKDTYEQYQKEGEMRTITVIADPDTENEKEYTTEVLKGDGIVIYSSTGQLELYADRACTELVRNADRYEDLTMYIRTLEEEQEAQE